MFLHLNLSISLLLGYLTFMVGIETATSSTVSIEEKLKINDKLLSWQILISVPNFLSIHFLNILTNHVSHVSIQLPLCRLPVHL